MTRFKKGDRVRLKLTEAPYGLNELILPGDTGTIVQVVAETSANQLVEVQVDGKPLTKKVYSYRLEPLAPPPAFYLAQVERGPSTKAHPTQEAAEVEAARLAVKHPGTDFYVMVPVAKASANHPVATLISL